MLEQFPQALKESRRWVCFDAAKTPINPATGKNAMPNEPATWGTLAAAQVAVSRFGLRGKGFICGRFVHALRPRFPAFTLRFFSLRRQRWNSAHSAFKSASASLK